MTSRERHISRLPGREKWIAGIAHARGTILPDIEECIRVGMRPSEIAITRRLQTGVEPDDSYRAKIANAMGHRPRKGLPLRTPEERRQARIAALNETKEEQETRVHLWLKLMKQIPKKEWPSERQRWIERIDEIKTPPIDIVSLAKEPIMQDVRLWQLLPVESYSSRMQVVIKAIDMQEIPLEDSLSLLVNYYWEANPINAQQELAELGIAINKQGIDEYEERMSELIYERRKFLQTLKVL